MSEEILISGYYGFDNTGDEAILSSILDSLNRILPDKKIGVFSSSPSRTEGEHKVKAIPRYSFQVIKAMWKSRLLISGGGGLLQDTTSIKTPVYYLSMILLAKLFRKKTMFYAQGIGPLNTFIGKKLTSYIANTVDLITVRDEASCNILKELGVVKPPVYITTDPVFLMKPPPSQEIEEIFKKEQIPVKGNYIGISVREWKENIDYPSIISRAADYFYEKFSLETVFIPMHLPSDLEFSGKIKSLMKNPSYIIKGKYKPEIIMGILGQMTLVIPMRLHSLIMASVFGIPSIPVAYDPKVANISKQLGLKYLSLEKLSYEELKNLVSQVYSIKEEINMDLKKRVDLLKEKSMENSYFVKQLLEKN